MPQSYRTSATRKEAQCGWLGVLGGWMVGWLGGAPNALKSKAEPLAWHINLLIQSSDLPKWLR